MCGIAGIISKKPIEEASIEIAIDHLKHRGPDAGSVFGNAHVRLGHRRLSIIDLSDAANQPFTDTSGRYTIVFNGEIYNYQQIRQRLEGKYQFTTSSDTEALLALYIAYGENFLNSLDGMFAFAIWDAKENSLFIARDRLGKKPFYYFHSEDTFVFASEVRSILATGYVKPRVAQAQITNYLRYQTVHQPNTILEDIYQLNAGYCGLLKDQKLSVKPYWEITNVPAFEDKGIEEVKKTVARLFINAVEKRMISDVPFGAFLSGGIDSSLIVACMSELHSTQVSTFSIVFDEPSFDESTYSRLIAKKYQTNHTEFLLKPETFLESTPEILKSMDMPSPDGANTYWVSKLTKEAGITVALSGLGGDELFGGYSTMVRYQKLMQNNLFWALPRFVRATAGSLAAHLMKNRKMGDLANASSRSFSAVYPIMRQAFSTLELQRITQRKELKVHQLSESLEWMNEKLSHLALLSQGTVGEIECYTRDLLLRDTDQMSMAHALEVRVPFFDHHLLEYVMSVPDKYKQPIYPKRLLVESLAPRLPDEVVHRKKMGFSLPWEYWLKNELRSFCNDRIIWLSKNCAYFDEKNLMAYWNQFLKDDRSIPWSRVWQLVVLADWLERNKVSE
ncbi:MAG: asparagine synthase (glutamine-hydrolyzing) [Saprospiraceae bacterium]|nr:asparagine synthase (glutamine-hydrolyzing) [Saprospiraceae bacterium]